VENYEGKKMTRSLNLNEKKAIQNIRDKAYGPSPLVAEAVADALEILFGGEAEVEQESETQG